MFNCGLCSSSESKASTCNAGDPGEGNGSPLQYSGLENSMDRGAWWATWGCKELDMTERLTHTGNIDSIFRHMYCLKIVIWSKYVYSYFCIIPVKKMRYSCDCKVTTKLMHCTAGIWMWVVVVSVTKLHPTLCDPMDAALQASVSFHLSFGVCSNSCPLSWWCHSTISSSVALFASNPQSFQALRSFPVSQLFSSGGQSIGGSASASVLPVNIQGWSPLRLVWSPCYPKDSWRVFFSTTTWKHQFFSSQPSLWSTSHICTWLLEKP